MRFNLRKISGVVKITVILLVLLGQFSLGSGSASANGTGSISGTVLGQDDLPLTGVSVRVEAIRKADGTGAASTYTDPADGTYTIIGLAFYEDLAVLASNEDPDVDGYPAVYYDNVDGIDWAVTIEVIPENPSATGVDFHLAGHDSVAVEHLTFNTRVDRILNDVNVRQAIAYGTDRQYILDNAFGPSGIVGEVLDVVMHPGVWFEAPVGDPFLNRYDYSPTTATSMLESAGWIDIDADGYREKDGNELFLEFATTDAAARVAAAGYFETQMAAIGIDVDVVLYPAGIFFSQDPAVSPLIQGNFDVAEFAWSVSDFDYLINVYNTDDPQNYGGFSSSTMDQDYDWAQGAKLVGDSPSFLEYALDWQYQFSYELPALPMFTRVSTSISGVVNGADGLPLTGVEVQVDVHQKSDDSIIATVSTDAVDGTYYVGGLPLDTDLYICASNEDPDVDGYVGECFDNVSASGWAVTILLTMDNPSLGDVDFTLNDHYSPYNIEQLTFNTRPERLLSDVFLRQAIAYGTDRQTILETIWEPIGTTGEILNVMLYPEEWFAAPSDDPFVTQYDYSPATAASLLASAGWVDSDADGILEKDGNDLSLVFATTNWPERVASADFFKTEMAAIGMEINIDIYPDLSFLSGGDYDIAEFAWGWGFGYDELVTMYLTGDSQNYGGFSGASLDNYYWLAQSGKVSNDTAYFLNNALEWQYEFSARLPALPMFSRIGIPQPVISGNIFNRNNGSTFTTAAVLLTAHDSQYNEVASVYSSTVDGTYELSVPFGFTGSVTPSLAGYWFYPTTWNYSNLISDVGDESYAIAPHYLLTVVKAGTGTGSVGSSPSGISCGADCSNEYEAGTSVKLTATASAGSAFTGWSGACGGMSTTCYVTMSKAKSVTASFTLNPAGQYFLSTVKVGSGSILSTPAGISCPTDCGEFYNSGTSVKLVATASAGYVFTGWSGACGGTTATCFVPMSKNKTVTATFLAVPAGKYYLGVKKAGVGTVTSVSPAGTINCGTDCSEFYNAATVVRLHATPALGYTFTGWSGACGGTADCFVNMSNHKFVKATFTVIPAFRGDTDPDAFLPGLLDLIAGDPLKIWRLVD